MRSRWTRTTSTGETALVATIRASSVIEAQNRSATSHRPIVCGGLDLGDRRGLQRVQRAHARHHHGADLLHLGIGQGEASQARADSQRLEIVGIVIHGGEDTGWPGPRARRSRSAARLGILGLDMVRRALIAVLVVLVLLGVLVGVGLWYLPGLIQRTVIWRLQAATGRTVTIQALDVSLTSGQFSIRGFRIADREPGPPLAEFEKLEGRFHRRSLLRGHVWIENLALTGPHARIVRLGPNRYNISDLLGQGQQPGGALDVSIDHFTIAGGWVELEDRVLKPKRTWRSDGIQLDARQLSTLDRKGTAIGFTTVAGALVNLRVEELQLAPVHLRAFLNVRDLDLALAALYLPGDAPLKIERGILDAAYTIVDDAKDGVTMDVEGVVEKVVLRRPGVPGDAVTTPALRFMVRELHQRPDAIALRYASVGGDVTVLDPMSTIPRKLVFSDFTATASGLEASQKARAQLAIYAKVPGG